MLTKLLTAAAGAAAPRRDRPPRAQVEPVAIDLIRRHGAEIMATARRYSSTREDAEDAYQRGLEILLTKAPSTSADDLVPWLKTVVKHEAYSLHRQRERAGQPTAPDRLAGPTAAAPDDQAERLERLQIGAEALGRLKPQEIRCMLLLAEGHSYKQIQELTGFSYTKVNRCLTEGRRSFLRRVEGIESGAECERLAPLLSALADGEASAKDMAVLRPHLRTCLACRAALRDAREVPARVAALAPIGLLAAGHGSAGPGAWAAAVRSAGDWVNERLTSFVLRGQDLIETASAHKLAAVAASAAALGGGGIATVEVGSPHGGGGGRHPGAAHSVLVKARPEPMSPSPAWRPAAATVPAPKRATSGHPHAHPHARSSAARPATGPAPEKPAPAAPAFVAPKPAQPAPTERQAPTRDERPIRPPETGEFGP
jgi:RNA polymerase sigma factor (sigma-70 family)